MKKPHYLSAIFSVALVAALLLALPGSAQSAPDTSLAQNPTQSASNLSDSTPDSDTPPGAFSASDQFSTVPLSITPARPNDTIPDTMPILADNIDGQLTYHYVPIALCDTAGLPVETLVDEYPTPPQRPIYILAPEHQYYLEFDFSEYAHRADPTQQDIRVSYTDALSDTQLGSIEALITETYINGSQAIFYGEIKFIADSITGLSLQCIQPEQTSYPTLRQSQIVFQTTPDQHPHVVTFYNTGWSWPQWNIRTYGHTLGATDPAETNIDAYFYPDTTPTTTPPAFLSNWAQWRLPN